MSGSVVRLKRHSPPGELGVDLVVRQRDRRELLAQVQDVQLVVLESQPRRLLLLDDADFDAPDLRHRLACHRRDPLLVERIVARLELPADAAKRWIGLEHDLVRALPFLEHVRAGADRVAVGVVGVGLDHLARHRAGIRQGEDVREVVVGFLEPDLERVTVEDLQAVDLAVVVELAGLFGVLLDFVESDARRRESSRTATCWPDRGSA